MPWGNIGGRLGVLWGHNENCPQNPPPHPQPKKYKEPGKGFIFSFSTDGGNIEKPLPNRDNVRPS